MHLNYFCFCILLIFTLNLKSISSYKFLDSSVIKGLIVNETKLLKSLQDHILEEEEKLNSLKLKILELKKQNLIASNNDLNYYFNPLVAFTLTRRFSVDWTDIEKYITNSTFLGYVQFYKNSTNFPTINILNNVASTFLNLQNFYNLNISKIVDGEINGINYNTSLTTRDSFELGNSAYRNSYFYSAVRWLKKALFQVEDGEEENMVEHIFRTLAQSYYSIGDIQSALKMTQVLLIVKPDDLNAKNNAEMLIDINSNIEINRNKYLYKSRNSREFEYDGDYYAKLCRHDYKRSPIVLRPLYCRYIDNSNPFLNIAPFKQEILNLDPFVCVFHDVLYDEEIQIIQDLVKTTFVDAAEFDPDTKKKVLSERRTSKYAVFDYEDLSNSDVLEQRSGDMTGLIMRPNEDLDVQKYEIGGKYVPHFDYLNTDQAHSSVFQRIATLIFYMNDVEQGGETVFPEIGVKVTPRKGSALFWYNTHSSGELDERTLHAGCPVLVGTKWLGTYWIQEEPQIFTRGCINSSRPTKIL